MRELGKEIITQADAHRLRGVSRQRISQLKAEGRFSPVVSPSGAVLDGLLYAHEVINLKEGKRGRPRLTADELAARSQYTHGFAEGDEVIWVHQPRDGYGYCLIIPATVHKLGGKRIQLTFEVTDLVSGEAGTEKAWVRPDELLQLEQFTEARPITSENGKSKERDFHYE